MASESGHSDSEVEEIEPTWQEYKNAVEQVYNNLLAINPGLDTTLSKWKRSLTNAYAKKRYDDLSQSSRQGVVATVQDWGRRLCNQPPGQHLGLPTMKSIFPHTAAKQLRNTQHSVNSRRARVQRNQERRAEAANLLGGVATPAARTVSRAHTPASQGTPYDTSQPTTPLPAAGRAYSHSPYASSHGSVTPAQRYPMSMQQRLPGDEHFPPSTSHLLVPGSRSYGYEHLFAPTASVVPNTSAPFVFGNPAHNPYGLAQHPTELAQQHLLPFGSPLAHSPHSSHRGSPAPEEYGSAPGAGGYSMHALGRRAARYYGTTPERWARGGAW
ncbi:hypothetical protein JCM10450v2_002306 [Rhodotorula kratochvilovae]